MIRGEIWWADLGIPFGSEPGFQRPVVIIQDDAFNRSRIQTVIVASITSNLSLAEAPGNVTLPSSVSQLSKEGVINVSQISTLDKKRLVERISMISQKISSQLDDGLRLIFDIH